MVQTIKFTCSTLPEPEQWEDAIYRNCKQENKIQLTIDNEEKTNVTVMRVIKVEKIPSKKEVIFCYRGLLGLIKSDKVYDPEGGYFDAQVNHTRKTCKLKIITNYKKVFSSN